MAYFPGPYDGGPLDRYVQEEFQRISQELVPLEDGAMQQRHVLPDKPRDGLFYADGTNWDPGEGQGLYLYDEGADAFIFIGGTAGVLAHTHLQAQITDANDANWDTAFGWGNHAGLYSLLAHNHTFDGLSNVTITANSDGEVPRWNGSAWINNTLAELGAAATGHNHTFDSLSNVTITAIASGEIPKWNGSAWINNTLAEAGIAAAGHNHTLDGLSNVTITSIASGEILKWNGSAWVNNTLAEAGIAAASAVNPVERIFATSIQTKTLSAGIADDSFMVGFTLTADHSYRVRGLVNIGCTVTTANFRVRMNCANTPQAILISYSHDGNLSGTELRSTGGTQDAATEQVFVSVVKANSPGAISIDGYIHAHASTTGDVDFQWAQWANSSGTNTRYAGSFIELEDLGIL